MRSIFEIIEVIEYKNCLFEGVFNVDFLKKFVWLKIQHFVRGLKLILELSFIWSVQSDKVLCPVNYSKSKLE
jgi:hypothetical protein